MLVVGSAMYRRPLAETLTSVPFPSSNEMNDRRCLLRAWQREVARWKFMGASKTNINSSALKANQFKTGFSFILSTWCSIRNP